MNRHQTSDALARRRIRIRAALMAMVAFAGAATFAAAAARVARADVHTVAHNRAAGHAAAVRRLAHVALPPGAKPVGGDPEALTRFVWLSVFPVGTPVGSNVVDLHRFFRVAQTPAAVFRWLNRHRPRGSTLAGQDQQVLHGRTLERAVSFAFRGVRDTITQEGVGFALTAARGGGTALRVEAWAMWLVPRPAFETVPDDVFAVVVSLGGSGTQQFPVSTITDPTAVRTLADHINSLRVVQPQDMGDCSPATFPRIDLRFLFAVGAAPVARAVGDGCSAIQLSALGRRGPPLSVGSTELGDLLWRLHAVPACAPGQLSASVAPRDPSLPIDPALGMLLRLTNVSRDVCGVKGFPGIRLRGADGQPLLARATNLDLSTHAAVLAPNTSATIALVWGATDRCHGTVATSIDVTPPGLPSALSIAVGSRKPPVDPCHRTLYVSPVAQAAAMALG